MRKFRKDYGVYTCPHVFRNERPVKLVLRDPDGDWQFLCGDEEAEDAEDCHHIGVGHLIDRDSSLEVMAELEPEEGAERDDVSSDWTFFELDSD